MPGDDAISVAVRDRLNALLASMIHQAKRIVLHDLRELDDGTFAATVTVNGANVASDPILVELREKRTGTTRSRDCRRHADSAARIALRVRDWSGRV